MSRPGSQGVSEAAQDANAAADDSLYFYSDNIRQLEALAAAGFVSGDTASRLQDIYKAYRLRLHHLVLDDKPALVDAEEFTTERHFVEALWKEARRLTVPTDPQ